MGRRFRRRMRHTGSEITKRWHEQMPRFFYWMVVVACGVGGTAAAINLGLPMAGGTHSEWWDEAFRYIFGTCVGIVFACKFTVAGGYKDINPDRLTRGNMVLNKDIDHMSGESPMPSDEPEIPGEAEDCDSDQQT